MSHHQFANVRTQSVKFVSTFELVLACAKHHKIEGDEFGAKFTPFFKLMNQVHAAVLNDLIPSHREAASWPISMASGAVDINMFAYFARKALESKGEDAALLHKWFGDIFTETRWRNPACALDDHFVIVNRLPEPRDTHEFTL